jgi:hypothetical protein
VYVIKRRVVRSKGIQIPHLQKMELTRKEENFPQRKSPPKLTKMSHTNKDFGPMVN